MPVKFEEKFLIFVTLTYISEAQSKYWDIFGLGNL
jgi:hypothetical protein